MLINEIVSIKEGGKSDGIRYNSEVGMLCGFMGIDPREFDPSNPQNSMNPSYLGNAQRVFNDIQKLLAPNFDAAVFNQWAVLGSKYKSVIDQKLSELNTSIQTYGWAGGTNISDSGPADIDFNGCSVSGVSIKAKGGITLANLTPKSLGLETSVGDDIFYTYAQPEYLEMKRKIFTDVLNEAKAAAGKVLAPLSDKYTIVYDPTTNKFTCSGKSTITASAEQILAGIAKNAKWQRVFGDWFQANWSSKKSYATPLYAKIATVFEKVIENHLSTSQRLAEMLRFAAIPYFYASASALYYVPSINDVSELTIKGLKYATPDGTSQRFIAVIGRPDSNKNAELDIYIRYANGMFEANPTVRVQNLKNPQFISWEKLI